MNNYSRIPLAFSSGTGSWLTSASGEKYLDFLSGIAVNSLGHGHPEIVAAIKSAAEKLVHVSNYYEIPEQELAAKTLCDLAQAASGGKESYRAIFGNSGAEANEAALKISRKKTGRAKFISFLGAFHGRTYGTLSVTPKPEIQAGFEPLLPDCEYVDYNSLEALKKIDSKTAAVIVEFVQAEGGINIADHEWITALFQQARKQGALIIADEIQTGCSRTGKFFSFEHYGVTPDIITLAKGIGGGFPAGVMLAKASVAEAFGPGSHGSTFAGSPLICSVVNAVLRIITEQNFQNEVTAKAAYFVKKLKEITAEHPDKIKEVRGLGLLIGMEFEKPGAAKNCWIELRKQHVLCGTAGKNVLRILPPLNTSKEEIDIFLAAMQEVLKET